MRTEEEITDLQTELAKLDFAAKVDILVIDILDVARKLDIHELYLIIMLKDWVGSLPTLLDMFKGLPSEELNNAIIDDLIALHMDMQRKLIKLSKWE